LASFPRAPEGADGPGINFSFAAMIGRALEPVLAPLGFNWQISVALVPGMAAREVAVAALGTVYAVGGGSTTDLAAILSHQWSLASGLAFLAWYVFAPQCMATLGVVQRETNSWKWPLVMFGYMITLAYAAALIVYQVAVAFGAG
ncbi:MAG TPA: nucleoside recognition domain-containing protein, partial [Phenylobacterium sp.]|nr:nucleoside recognition domain-containing protein [Phenylobacterium sp.]